MKKLLATSVLFICSLIVCAEKISPTYGVKIYREVESIIIEQAELSNVIIELDAADIDDIFKEGVKVTVTDKKTKKKIYKKRFSKSFLYFDYKENIYFVGKGDALLQVILFEKDKQWIAKIREYGIY